VGPESMRSRFSGLSIDRLSQVDGHLAWTSAELAEHRTAALRSTLRHAADHSSGWRDRLSAIDIDRATVDDLRLVPPATKADLMSEWDELVCAPQLNLTSCQALLRTGEVVVDHDHVVITSSGSSGTAAVMVYSIAELAMEWAVYMRVLRRWAALEGSAEAPSVAVVAAPPGPHISSVLGWLQLADESSRFSVGDETSDLVDGLNRVDPSLLIAYPSALPRLLDEAAAGRLTVRPRLVLTIAEPTPDGLRQAVKTTWGAAVSSNWAATEVGMLGTGDPADDGLRLHDDHVIIEPVDADGALVEPGQPCDKVFVTTLSRRAFPLIRYEITDQLLAPTPRPGSPFGWTGSIDGRADDSFRYGSPELHPALVRAALAKAGVVEYQAQQTQRGVGVQVIPGPSTNTDALREALRRALDRAGLTDPEVTVEAVSGLPANVKTGKLPRFVRLPPAND